jgi:tRNA G18 (ribose-2'-O)-methylase SpoU
MFRLQRIESLDLPELQPYRTMRQQMQHWEQGIFVAEGEKVVRRLLESKFIVVSLLLPEKWLRELELLLESRPEVVEVFVAEKDLLETLTGFSMYQGLLALGKIPKRISLQELLASSRQPRLLVATDGLCNAENLGALVRNCAAFGAHGLIVGESSSSPFLRRAVRSSMGTIFDLPVVETASLVRALGELRKAGVHCVAAHPQGDGRRLSQADLRNDCCIIVGSEGHGISPEVLATCNEAVAIPMAGTVDSLNVGSAAAVFLYEAKRQRGKM